MFEEAGRLKEAAIWRQPLSPTISVVAEEPVLVVLCPPSPFGGEARQDNALPCSLVDYSGRGGQH